MFRKLVWLAIIVGLVACSQPEQTGSIRGVVQFGPTGQALPQARSLHPDPAVVPGEVLLGFAADTGAEFTPPALLRAAGTELALRGNRNALGVYVYTFAAETEAETWRVIRQLEQSGEFAEVIPNVLMKSFNAPLAPSELWHYDLVGVEDAWASGYTGAGVTVAVVDTGGIMPGAQYPHPDLTFVGGYNFVDGNADYSAAGVHGVHVAGTVGGNGDVFKGIAYEANLVAARAMTGNRGSLSHVIDATWWAAGGTIDGVPANPNPARVINLSLGAKDTPCYPAAESLFALLSNAGIAVVVAAGNEPGGIAVERMMPGNCPSVITVGAVEPNKEQASYTAFGNGIDIMGPGGAQNPATDRVLSTGIPTATDTAPYFWEAGTSMAAPHVAGLAALMVEKNPSISPSEIRRIIQETAQRLPGCNGCGAGLVSASAALQAVPASSAAPNFPPLPARPRGYYPAFVVALHHCKQGATSCSPEGINYESSQMVLVPELSTSEPFAFNSLEPGDYTVLAWRPFRGSGGVLWSVNTTVDYLATAGLPVSVRPGAVTGQVWLPLGPNVAPAIDPKLLNAMTQVVTEHW